MARKREPISSRLGAGTDALFSGADADQPRAEIEASTPVSQGTVLEAHQETSVPVGQLGGHLINQHDSEVVSQQDDQPAGQDAGKPAHLVKATFYLTPALVMKLEEIRFARMRGGERVDKSALVREAIELLTE
jgi:hypothetical protein